VLFIHPEATGANFYKIFVPFWVLKQTNVVNTALSGWSKYNPIKRLRTDERFPIRSTQILWADTIVFPFTNQPLKEFYEAVKTINPNCRIVFHVDFDFLDMPQGHPLKDAFDDKSTVYALENAVYSDCAVVTNPLLATRLMTKAMELGYELNRERLAVQLLCYDDDVFMRNTSVNMDKSDLFNLVVLAGDNQILDVKATMPLIKEAKKKHGKSLKITFFGMNKNKEDFQKLVKGLEYVPEKAVPVWDYYATLNSLKADLVLIPNDGTEWSQRSHDYKRFVDCSMLNLPVITSNNAPFNVVMKDNETGFLYDTDAGFMKVLDTCIGDKNKLQEVGAAANSVVEQNFFYAQDKLQRLINLLG
jgi:hypothetical protein